MSVARLAAAFDYAFDDVNCGIDESLSRFFLHGPNMATLMPARIVRTTS